MAGEGAAGEVGEGVGAFPPDFIEEKRGAVAAEFRVADLPIVLAGADAGGGALGFEVGIDRFKHGGQRVLDDEVARVVLGQGDAERDADEVADLRFCQNLRGAVGVDALVDPVDGKAVGRDRLDRRDLRFGGDFQADEGALVGGEGELEIGRELERARGGGLVAGEVNRFRAGGGLER